MISASILTVVLQDLFGITGAMMVYCGLMFIALLWLIFVFTETLSFEKRQINRIKYDQIENERKLYEKETNQNNCQICLYRLLLPLKPLLAMNNNKILLWFGIMALFTGLPESGVQDLLGTYSFEILNLKNDDTAETTFTSIATASLGTSMLISQLLFLPCLMKFCGKNDIFLICVALLSIICFGVYGVFFYFVPNNIFGYVSRKVFCFFGQDTNCVFFDIFQNA